MQLEARQFLKESKEYSEGLVTLTLERASEDAGKQVAEAFTTLKEQSERKSRDLLVKLRNEVSTQMGEMISKITFV